MRVTDCVVTVSIVRANAVVEATELEIEVQATRP